MSVRLHQIYRICRLLINSKWRSGIGSGWQTPFGVSALVHAAGLGMLAFVAIANSRQTDFATVISDLGTPAPEVAVRIDPPVESPVMRGSSSGGREGPAGPVAAGIETARPAQVRLSTEVEISQLALEARLPPTDDLSVSVLGKKVGKGIALGGGFGSGVGDGQGNGSGTQFFEIATAGTKFVYVLDGSGSMTEPHSEARTRLDRVKIELVRSIGGLPEDMEFFVIFFNRVSVPMPAEKLQPATLANKRKYLEWCVKVKGGGGTDPRAALKYALELKPDVIYLLTDGVIKDNVATEVSKLNTRGASIHTFCFGDASGEALLKEIAQENNGIYKFIP